MSLLALPAPSRPVGDAVALSGAGVVHRPGASAPAALLSRTVEPDPGLASRPRNIRRRVRRILARLRASTGEKSRPLVKRAAKRNPPEKTEVSAPEAPDRVQNQFHTQNQSLNPTSAISVETLLAAARFDYLRATNKTIQREQAHEVATRLGLFKSASGPGRPARGYAAGLKYCTDETHTDGPLFVSTGNQKSQNKGCSFEIRGGLHDLCEALKRNVRFQRFAKVRRVDVAIDFHFEGAYETLVAAAALAKFDGVRERREEGDAFLGRTMYFGERDQETYLRIYEKGKQMSAKGEIYDENHVRVEFEFKPHERYQESYFLLGPAQTIQASGYACAVIRRIAETLGDPSPKLKKTNMSAAIKSKSIYTSGEACIRQYAPTLLRIGIHRAANDSVCADLVARIKSDRPDDRADAREATYDLMCNALRHVARASDKADAEHRSRARPDDAACAPDRLRFRAKREIEWFEAATPREIDALVNARAERDQAAMEEEKQAWRVFLAPGSVAAARAARANRLLDVLSDTRRHREKIAAAKAARAASLQTARRQARHATTAELDRLRRSVEAAAHAIPYLEARRSVLTALAA